MNKKLFAIMLAICAMLPFVPATAQDVKAGSVINATFTSNVAEGAPVDFREAFFTDTPVVYYYSELLDLEGQTVKHRWSLEGKVMQEVPIQVTRARQPAWSKSTMQPQWTGNWTVEVLNGKGQVIDMRTTAPCKAMSNLGRE